MTWCVFVLLAEGECCFCHEAFFNVLHENYTVAQ